MAHHASATAHHASATAQQMKRKCPDRDDETADLCANNNGCGFFGDSATGGMCSKCYREQGAAAVTGTTPTTNVFIAPAASSAPPEKKARMIATVSSSDTTAATAAADTSKTSVMQKALPANRCATCRKKVGLLGFRCRCDGTFCSVHRYSDKHSCGFDYKTAGQEQIAKHNPLVVADKITTRI